MTGARTGKGDGNGRVMWYVVLTSYSVFYAVARSRSLGNMLERTMKPRSGSRQSQYVGALRPGK